MIKDREVAMVNGASIALNYKNKNPDAWDEEIVASVMQNLSATADSKLYGVAAASEILKMRKSDRTSTDKQLLQAFVNNIRQFVAKMNEGISE